MRRLRPWMLVLAFLALLAAWPWVRAWLGPGPGLGLLPP